jgi:23S rRNA pseudouridine1911/1915/1917 synthase
MNDLKVIFEDNSLIVFDKPSGLIVNKSITAPTDTLQNYLESLRDVNAEVDEDDDSDFGARSGIVHRLDKDTSGVLVVAKTPEAFVSLQKQFKGRQTKKEYVAIVHGILADNYIEVNAPLKRNPKSPLKFAVVSGGRESITEIEKVKELKLSDCPYTFVKVLPHTGRTHQIRVHLTSLNHPIAGDVLYCTQNLLEQDASRFHRLMLHAQKLGFFHPATHNFVEFTSPLPSEFMLM